MNRAKIEALRDQMRARDWNRDDVGLMELHFLLDALLEDDDPEVRAWCAGRAQAAVPEQWSAALEVHPMPLGPAPADHTSGIAISRDSALYEMAARRHRAQYDARVANWSA
jgi:hypothetical protein